MDIINSAEGVVANFNTNLAKPLASSKYGIEATQDLNGQTGPYPPGGGGINLWNEEWELGTYDTNTGEKSTVSNRIRSKDLIPITPHSTIYFSQIGNGTGVSYCFYNENRVFKNGYYRASTTGGWTVNGDSDWYYVSISPDEYYGTTYNNNISVSMSTKNYAPYSNICPIVGADTVDGHHRGKNWLKNIIAQGQSANHILLGQTNVNTHETRLKAGTYTVSYKTRSSNIPSIYLKKQGVSGNVKLNNYDTKATFTVDDGTYRFWLYKSNGINYEDIYDAQIELIPNHFNKANYQNLRTDYEYLYNSYYCKEIQLKPNTAYTVSQNAGTTSIATILINNNRQVNATGYFDLRLASSTKDFTTDDTGKLYIGVVSTVADWEYNSRVNECGVSIIEKNTTETAYEPYQGEEQSISLVPALYTLYPEYAPYFQGLLAGTHDFVDLGSLVWGYVDTSSNNRRFYSSSISSNIEIPESTSVYPNIICVKYKTKLVSQYNQAITGITVYTNGTVQIYDSELKSFTTADFKTTMSGIYIIYKLATPKTPTITEDQFKMLLQAFGATCYGGEVITTESGARKLKITHKFIEINPNNPNCNTILMYGTYVPSTGKGNFFYTTAKSEWGWSNNSANDGVGCDSLAIKQQVSQNDTTSGISWLAPSGIIRWKDTARMDMTIEDYREYLKVHPIKCIYKLGTPLIIDLPDGETFTSFIGYNNVFCDTGDTSVDFYISVPIDGINVNLVPGGVIPSVNVSQNDSGRKVRAQLLDGDQFYTIPEGYIVTGKVLTTGREIVDIDDITAGSNYVDLVIPDEATALPGASMCKLRVKDPNGTYDVGFSIFFIEVEQKP